MFAGNNKNEIGNNGGNPFVIIPDVGLFNELEDIIDDSLKI